MAERPVDLIADWNEAAAPTGFRRAIHVHDETLRDGLQSPSVQQPHVDACLELLHLMDAMGIESVDLGMPISNATARSHVMRLAQEIRTRGLTIKATCAARTLESDIAAVAEVAQSTGIGLSVMAFVGISPIRLYVENWQLASILRQVTEAVTFARREGLEVCLVTEDTTRSRLDVAMAVYEAGLEAGAERICVCDTVGFALPWGAAELIRLLREGLTERGWGEVRIDWHGHNDRGVALANSLAAAAAGADRLHGTALGIGERAGNTPMEQLLINLDDLGSIFGDITLLPRYCDLAAQACGLTVPNGQPLVGSDAFRTATGVHAAAIRKAMDRGDTWIAERVYAGVPASRVGRVQQIEVGRGSGRSNILHWLDRQGIEPEDAVVDALERAVAQATRIFRDDELLALVSAVRSVAVAVAP